MKRILILFKCDGVTPSRTAFSGLGLDFIVKYGVFHTRAGKARLKNSFAIFKLFDSIKEWRIFMSKYDALWVYVQRDGSPTLKLTFGQIQEIAGIPIDHSFLKYKKELTDYGYQVGKISMKEQTVIFKRT